MTSFQTFFPSKTQKDFDFRPILHGLLDSMDWFLGEICCLAVLAVPVNGKIDWIMMSIFMIIISESYKPNVRFKFVEPSNHDCGSQLGVYLFAMLKSTWAIPILFPRFQASEFAKPQT